MCRGQEMMKRNKPEDVWTNERLEAAVGVLVGMINQRFRYIEERFDRIERGIARVERLIANIAPQRAIRNEQ
jgi:hypothetical protein